MPAPKYLSRKNLAALHQAEQDLRNPHIFTPDEIAHAKRVVASLGPLRDARDQARITTAPPPNTRPLPNNPAYRVTPEGRVYNLRTGRQCPVNQHFPTQPRVAIDGKLISIARLVALAYLPNPNQYRFIEFLHGSQIHPNNLMWTPTRHNVPLEISSPTHPVQIIGDPKPLRDPSNGLDD